jgi:hypothetical protein
MDKADYEPFMEHPTGKYATALAAIEDTVSRLRGLEQWNQWITFCAQGEGTSPDSIHFAEIRLLSDFLEVDAPCNIAEVCAQAKVAPNILIEAERNRYSVATATPKEVAQILDALFRGPLGIHPLPDEDNDYAVGAEW